MKFQFSLSFTRNFHFYPGGVSSNQWFSRILTGPGKGRTLFSHPLLLDVFKYSPQKGTFEERIQCRQLKKAPLSNVKAQCGQNLTFCGVQRISCALRVEWDVGQTQIQMPWKNVSRNAVGQKNRNG